MSLTTEDFNLNIGERAMISTKKKFRPLLYFCFFVQISAFVVTVKCLVDQTLSDKIFQKFQVGPLMFIIFFQFITSIIGFFSTIYFFESAWKGLYGYGEDRLTKLLCALCKNFSIFGVLEILAFLGSISLYSIGAYLFVSHQNDFKHHGIFFWVLATTTLLYAIILFRRFREINHFVSDALHANGVNCIPLTEQNARDLFHLQQCEQEVHTYIYAPAWTLYRRHIRALRHAEFYAIQKWIAQLERIMAFEDNKEIINGLIKEMTERCRIYRISEEDQERYRQLAVMPLIFVPVDQCSCTNEDECE